MRRNETRAPQPGSLDRLTLRFRAQEEVRRELGNECRARGDIETAMQMEAKADAYASARRELERVMAGETTPGAYDDWFESQNAEVSDGSGS